VALGTQAVFAEGVGLWALWVYCERSNMSESGMIKCHSYLTLNVRKHAEGEFDNENQYESLKKRKHYYVFSWKGM
jgi:hypothetical protein